MANVPGIPVWREVGATPLPRHSGERRSIVIVGAGPVGLTLALDLGRRGHDVVVLNRLDFVAAGSKAICFAKRTLEIWDRLGIAAPIVAQGVVWDVGKVFWGAHDAPIYRFDLSPLKRQKMPGFVNLQQYHVEERLLEAVGALPNVELRWGHELVGVERSAGGVRASIRCADGAYPLEADWLVACDGSKSSVRHLLGLEFEGRVFEDNFLIADIRMKDDRPSERWFWFDPPFNRGRSALLHKQPEDVWRLDFQLGWDIDRDAAIRPEHVEPLVRGMLGPDVDFEPVWYSLYTFQCRRLARFVHDRIIFAGDSAHLVSPFGARGCNGGVADAANLGWKLDLVIRGAAADALLESYDHEATLTADENIRHSTRSTDFMTPADASSRVWRDVVLELAGEHDFARPMVNSGRLSSAVSYPRSPLGTPDAAGDSWRGIGAGAPAIDAPLGTGWLLERLGNDFSLIGCRLPADVPAGISRLDIEELGDPEGLVAERYDLALGSAYLVRPDGYVAARWRAPTAAAIAAAHARATGQVAA